MNTFPNPYGPPPKPPLAPRLVGLGASTLLWLAACAMPALYVQYTDSHETNPPWLGVECVFMGPLGAFYNCFAWYANLTALVSALLLCLRRNVGAAVLSAISLVLAASIFVLFAVDLAMDEGGVRHGRVTSLGPAVALWALSLAIPGVVALWRRARESNRR